MLKPVLTRKELVEIQAMAQSHVEVTEDIGALDECHNSSNQTYGCFISS